MEPNNIDHHSPALKRQRLERVSFELLCEIIRAGDSNQLREKLSDGLIPDLNTVHINNMNEDYTLLMQASEEGQIECVKVLLEFGASVDLRLPDKDEDDDEEDEDEDDDEAWFIRKNAIYVACEKGHFDIVKLLLETDPHASINHPEFRPLYEVCRREHLEAAKLLVEHGAELQDDGQEYGCTALMEASGSGNADLVEYLISKGADVNDENKYNPHALLIACWGRHLGVMEVLLKHGAYVDATQMGADSGEDTSLNIACQRGNMDMIRLLLKYGADMNRYNREDLSPFITAYLEHNTEAIDLFLESGMDLNCNESGWTYQRNGENIPIRDKRTPLMHACGRNDVETVKRLLAHGADVNVISESTPGSDYYVNTAVLDAIVHEEVLQILLEHGADVNLTDSQGNTALLSLLTNREYYPVAEPEPMSPAAIKGVTMLLELGMDIAHKNHYGKTALDYVVAGTEIEALVKEYTDRKPLLK